VSDRVFIRGLRVDTVIGVYGWERSVRQTLVLDLELAADIAGPAATDDVGRALDYDAVCQRLRRYGQESQWQLVETFAEGVAKLLREEFGVPWLHLRLAKPGAVAGADAVGVIIERGARP
jgi:dihydroneopterin aldolase